MKSEDEWLACRPLADENQKAWVEAIQGDAIRSSVNYINNSYPRMSLLKLLNELRQKASALDPIREIK